MANKPNTAAAGEEWTFDFERLPAYRRAEDFVAWRYRQMGSVSRRDPYMADQLHRAARSIALNIGEGGGEYSPPEKAHFYRMARRSATECVAIANILAGRESSTPLRERRDEPCSARSSPSWW